jgi:hypothetical protein
MNILLSNNKPRNSLNTHTHPQKNTHTHIPINSSRYCVCVCSCEYVCVCLHVCVCLCVYKTKVGSGAYSAIPGLLLAQSLESSRWEEVPPTLPSFPPHPTGSNSRPPSVENNTDTPSLGSGSHGYARFNPLSRFEEQDPVGSRE